MEISKVKGLIAGLSTKELDVIRNELIRLEIEKKESELRRLKGIQAEYKPRERVKRKSRVQRATRRRKKYQPMPSRNPLNPKTLNAMVLEVCRQGEPLTYKDVYARIERAGYRFGGTSSKTSRVAAALSILRRKRLFEYDKGYYAKL